MISGRRRARRPSDPASTSWNSEPTARAAGAVEPERDGELADGQHDAEEQQEVPVEPLEGARVERPDGNRGEETEQRDRREVQSDPRGGDPAEHGEAQDRDDRDFAGRRWTEHGELEIHALTRGPLDPLRAEHDHEQQR